MSRSLKNIGIVSILTFASRILGLVRDAWALAIFGGSAYFGAWTLAFTYPNLFRRLLAEGSLTTAFIPTIQEEIVANGKPGAYRLLSNVTCWAFLVSGLVVAIGVLVLSQSRLIPGHEAKWYMAADFSMALFPYLLFISLAAAFNATLNVQHRFLEPTLSPIWLNLCMIATLAGAWFHWAGSAMAELHWLTAGVLLGGFFQMAVPAVVLMRDGWRPAIDFTVSPWVRKIAAMMGPGIFGTAIYQINIAVSRTLAFHVSDEGTTLLFSSNRLMELPIGLFAVAVSSVVFPLIARHAAENNLAKMGEDFRKGLRLILVINLPAAVGLGLLAHPIVTLLYERHNFRPSDADQMAGLVALFAIGLPFFSVVNLTIRAFYAVKDTKTPVKIGVVDFATNVVLSLLLIRWFGLRGLVMATTTAIIVQTVLLGIALRRKLPSLDLRPLLPSLLKVIAASIAMGIVVYGAWAAIQARVPSRHGAAALGVFAVIPLAVLVYGILLWILRIEGRDDLQAVVRKLFRRA